MRALLVHAHPEPRSFSAALRDVAVTTLSELGYAVTVSDLYAMRWKATLDRDDFTTTLDAERLNLPKEQRHAAAHGGLAPDIARELDELRGADLVLLSFPLWWFSMPAILKGWIDRVFVSGEVYGRTALFERGKLAGKRAMLTVTTGAPEQSFGRGSLNGDLLDILMPIHRGTLGFTGMTVLPPFVGYHVPYLDDAARAALLAAYAEHLRSLEGREPLAMPRLADHEAALGELLRARGR